MNRNLTTIGIVASLFFYATISYSQEFRSRWGFGFNAGGQKIYGDRRNTDIGIGFEGLATYRITEFADLSFALGYSLLKYNFLNPITNTFKSNSTNLINIDVKGKFDVVSKGPFRPFLTLGLGLINFQVSNSNSGRFSDAAFFGGGGFKYQVSSQLDWLIGADYRFTTCDQLDDPTLRGKEGKSNDGYLNVRTGITYYLPQKGEGIPEVIAMEKAPFYELEETEPQPEYQIPPDKETKDMEEYIKLKSRIDELSEHIDSKENEISKLQSKLQDSKQKVTSLEKKVSKQPPVSIGTVTARSGFADIYEEALTHFYNKQYNEAISLFNLLLQQFPNHSLAGNCQYWIGKCDFYLGRYQNAIEAFYKVLSYNRSPKKDDALFVLGKTYLKTGAGERAKESFSRLVREYPNSEYVAEAKDYLSKL